MTKFIISFISITYLLFNSPFIFADAPAPEDIGFEECEYGRLLTAEPEWWDAVKKIMKGPPSFIPDAIRYAGTKKFLNTRKPITMLIRVTIYEGDAIECEESFIEAEYRTENGRSHTLINNTHTVIFDKTDRRWYKRRRQNWVCSKHGKAMEPSHCPFTLVR